MALSLGWYKETKPLEGLRDYTMCGLARGSVGWRPRAPFMDLAGSRMLRELQAELASHGISLRIICARGSVRDLLRADGIEDGATWPNYNTR